MNIFTRLDSDMKRQFKPYSAEEVRTMEKAKADASRGLKPQSKCPLYVEAYSTEKSFNLIQGAQ